MVWMAQLNNGRMGYPRNDKAAIALNHAPAMGAMAGAYENGLHGLKRDPAEVKRWREREARQHEADEKKGGG